MRLLGNFSSDSAQPHMMHSLLIRDETQILAISYFNCNVFELMKCPGISLCLTLIVVFDDEKNGILD